MCPGFQVSPEFCGSRPLVRCHLIMAAAVAEQEALKVQAWLIENGIESTADFAFWFTNYEEALQEAGRAVANAWEIARKTSEPGIAGLVRRIFEAERAGQVEAIPVLSQSLRIKPTRAKRALSAPVPGRRSGYEKEVQPSMAMDEEVTQKFMDMLLLVGQHRSDDPRARTNFRAIIREVLTRAEPATVKKGLQTWQELQTAMATASVVELDAHFLAQFARESSAPTRVYHALRWLGRNFPLSMDLALLVAPTKQVGGRYGGGRQAPVVPPPLIHYLDDLLTSAADSKQWSAILAAWMMVFGVVRFGHVQRSNLAFWNDAVIVFFCQKGKQLGTREGFFWSIPRFTMGGQDIMAIWLPQEKAIRASMASLKRKFHHCAFDLAEGRPLTIDGFLGAVREHLKVLVTNIGDLTSYSFRRVSATVAALAERSEPEKIALGGWIDRGTGLATTAARYNAQKARQSDQLKIAMMFVLRQLRRVDNWHSVSLSMCVREWTTGMQVADDAIASAGAWTYSAFQIPNMPIIKELSLEKSQVVRLRARTMLKRPLTKASEVAPRIRLVEAGSLPVRSERVAPSSSPTLRARAEPEAVPLPVSREEWARQMRARYPTVESVRQAKLAGELYSSLRPDVPASIADVQIFEPMEPAAISVEVSAPAASAASSAAPAASAAASAESLEAEEFFNREATKWNQSGHSGNPEPLTLIWKASNGMGSVWLGGLPTDADLRFMEENNITLLASAMDKTASEAGGYRGSRALQLAVPVSYRGRGRQEKWLYLRQVLVATLGVGQSAWFHCMAGVHRGPILCASAVAFVQRLAFWKVYENIERLRAVDRGGVLNRSGGADIFSWAEGIAAAPTEPLKLHLPVQWVASARRNATWHVASTRRVENRMQPFCKWRQSTTQSVFKGEVITAESVAEAVVIGREFCKNCLAVVPAGDQALIRN